MTNDIQSTVTDATVQKRYPQNNLAACMSPWTEDFQLDVPVFEDHVQAAIDEGRVTSASI